MKMTKKLFKMAIIVSLLVNGALLNAQVTVGDNTSPNATLDVVLAPGSTTLAGVIAPRVDRLYLNNNNTNYGTNQTGAIVYVTDATVGSATGQAINVGSIGYYYFDGALWQPMGGAAATVPNVLRGITTDYTALPTDDFLIFQSSTVALNLTFPTLTNANIGKTLYVTDTGSVGVNLPVASLLNQTHTVLYPGYAMQIIYVGQNQWEVFGGQ